MEEVVSHKKMAPAFRQNQSATQTKSYFKALKSYPKTGSSMESKQHKIYICLFESLSRRTIFRTGSVSKAWTSWSWLHLPIAPFIISSIAFMRLLAANSILTMKTLSLEMIFLLLTTSLRGLPASQDNKNVQPIDSEWHRQFPHLLEVN